MLKEKAIKLTKKLEAMLRRYEVTLRDKNSVVHHPVYGTNTEVSPLAFAVYEAAIKSLHLHWWNTSPPPERPGFAQLHVGASCFDEFKTQALAHHKQIAQRDNFDLIERDMDAQQTRADYHECCHILAKAGLYYDLLD
jgi:hypothetical protein